MKLKIKIEGPGSESYLDFEVGSAEEVELLQTFAKEWNEAVQNQHHAAPYITVEKADE